MIQSDAELIQRTLDGDQDAFGSLVNKYQKGVHALVWRKIGDFHIAQEITQDTFLRAYEKLGTLKRSDLLSDGSMLSRRTCVAICSERILCPNNLWRLLM